VVEGYADVLALVGAGVDETVATMGTACTPDHLRLLLRLAPHARVLAPPALAKEIAAQFEEALARYS